MATVQTPGERYVDFDEFVEYQLDRARNGIKWTDILTAVAGVASLIIGYLVVFVIADHWIFKGGVPQSARLIALLAIGILSLAWLGAKVVWPYLRKVNGLYAARMLEQAEPSLRGSLFGLVDSRRSGRVPVEEVRRALEKRAATTLSSIDVESAMDRRPLMQMSYVLLAVVLVACAYAILSPKRIGPSLLRALAPASSIGVATRTEILDVRPGDAKVIAGSQIDVEVLIRGEAPEKVYLYYSTDDRRFVDEPIEMRLTDETTRAYRAALIGDTGRGLTQNLTYRIQANDDAAGPFSVTVDLPPAAAIKALTLDFPAYTRRERETRESSLIEAIEGTKVKLTAEANQPLKSAKLVFADDDRFLSKGEEVPLRLDSDGTTLTAEWTLTVRSDGTSPSFYRIECRNLEGKTNPDPAVYPINIRADQPPEITLLDPKSDIERPANAVVPIMLDARDPDFELREIILRLERQGQELPERTVLWEGTSSAAAVRYDWNLAPLGLKPGDVVTFYAQARDNREPESNRRNTPKLNVTIQESISDEAVQEQLAQDKQRQDEELASSESNETATEQGAQPNADASDEPSTIDEPASEESNGDNRPEYERSESGESQSSTSDEADSRDGEPVKNDGTQDDEVLRRLIERQREQHTPEESAEKQTQSDEQQSQNEERQSGDETGTQDPQSKKGDKQSDDRQKQPASENGRSETERSESDESERDPKERQPSQNTEKGQQESQSQDQEKKSDQKSANGESQSSNESGASGSSNTSSENPQDQSSNGSGSQSNGERAGQAGSDANGPPSEDAESSEGSKESGTEMSSGDESLGTESGETGANAADGDSEQSGSEGTAASESQSSDSKEESSSQQDGEPTESESPSGAASGDTNRTETTSNNSGTTTPAKADPATGDSGTDNGPRNQQMEPSEPGRPGTLSGEAEDTESSESPQNVKTSDPQSDGKENPNDDPKGAPSSNQGSAGQPEKPGQSTNPKDAKSEDGQQKQSSNKTGGDAQSSGAADSPEQESGDRSKGAAGSEPAGSKPSQDQSTPGTGGESEAGSPEGSQGGSASDEMGETSPTTPSSNNSEAKGGSGKQSDESSDSDESEPGTTNSQKPTERRDASRSGEEKAAEPNPNGSAPESGKSQDSKGQGGKPGSDSPSGSSSSTSNPGTKPGNGGSASSGQADQNGSGESTGSAGAPDATNEEFAKQATDLALKNLENDLRRGDVDSELLEELGWTEDDMKRFAERLRKNLSMPTGEESPEDAAKRLEFEHMLENLSFGETSSPRKANAERIKDVGNVGTVNPQVPSEYRDAFEAFTRNVAGRKTAPSRKK